MVVGQLVTGAVAVGAVAVGAVARMRGPKQGGKHVRVQQGRNEDRRIE